MRRHAIAVIAGLFFAFAATGAQAMTYQLTDFAVNSMKNGGDANFSATPAFSGLGSYTLAYSGAGSYNVLSFFDYDLGLSTTGFLNEYGYATGSLGSNQQWQIADPGSLAESFIAGSLTNNSALGAANQADDAAMALGYQFDLTATQTAYLNFTVSDQAPTSGFYLTQTDGYTGDSLFVTSSFRTQDADNNPVPEPSTMALLGFGIAGLALYRRRKNA